MNLLIAGGIVVTMYARDVSTLVVDRKSVIKDRVMLTRGTPAILAEALEYPRV